MDLPVINRRVQGLSEHQKNPGRRGRLDLRQLGPGVDGWHGGGHSRNIWELLTLLDILATQRHIDQKELDQLVGNLCSMKLTVPLLAVHLFHIQHALSQGGGPGLYFASL